MYTYLGDFPTGATIFFPFETFNSTGASVTISGLAVTDIEVYKGASMTQRASDAGYALVDTDGIDLDGITGIHGFTIDTSDNTDSGFYAVGNDYTVVVSSITVDGQTCNKIVGRFSIGNRSVTAASIAAIETDTQDIQSRLPAALVSGRMDASVGAMASGVLTATAIAGDAFTAAKFASDVTTELQSGLATSSALSTLQTTANTIAGYLDTEMAATLAAVDTEVAAIKAVTDLLPNGGALTSIATAANLATVDGIVDDIKQMIGHKTTIATLASQTSFTLTAGSADDNAYNGWGAYVVDQSTATQIALGVVSDYTGSTKTVTLTEDPAIFTMATGDTIILLPGKLTDTVLADLRKVMGNAFDDSTKPYTTVT